ncbi:MAG: hypothetical protein IJ542_01145 [Clostridia bacterium]|nr:hypothetical protein [Clostridia bacterium]
MRNLVNLLADGASALDAGYQAFKSVIITVLPIVISVVLLIGMFFGISMGIKFAKAEDADARDKAKGQLINLAIGIGVTAVILLVAYTLISTGVFDGLFSNLA